MAAARMVINKFENDKVQSMIMTYEKYITEENVVIENIVHGPWQNEYVEAVEKKTGSLSVEMVTGETPHLNIDRLVYHNNESSRMKFKPMEKLSLHEICESLSKYKIELSKSDIWKNNMKPDANLEGRFLDYHLSNVNVNNRRILMNIKNLNTLLYYKKICGPYEEHDIQKNLCYACTLCDEKFSSLKNCLMHRKVHKKNDKYFCDRCSVKSKCFKKMFYHWVTDCPWFDELLNGEVPDYASRPSSEYENEENSIVVLSECKSEDEDGDFMLCHVCGGVFDRRTGSTHLKEHEVIVID